MTPADYGLSEFFYVNFTVTISTIVFFEFLSILYIFATLNLDTNACSIYCKYKIP